MIMTPSLKKLAAQKNVRVQINCHAPDGYSGAYSVGIGPVSPQFAPMVLYSLPNTAKMARQALKSHIISLV